MGYDHEHANARVSACECANHGAEGKSSEQISGLALEVESWGGR